MSTSSVRRRSLRAVLYAGLSFTALSIAAPAQAADVALPLKALPPPTGQTLLWVEGGAFWTGSDPIPYVAGFGAALGADPVPTNGGNARVSPSQVGWDVAAGFDHRFAGTRWHINAEGRYGQNKGQAAFQESLLIAIGAATITARANSAVDLKEYHWHADMGVGYDILTGPSALQVKFGLRVAQVSARTSNTTNLAVAIAAGPVAIPITASTVADVRRSFLGAGPRVGLEGSVPLFAGWTLDYKGDAAMLFGNTKIDSDSSTSVSIVAPPVFALVIAGIPDASFWSKQISVFNADVQAGIGYWITPYVKVAASYRLDAFLDPLRAAPDDTLPGRSIDRFYHGPKLSVTGRFN